MKDHSATVRARAKRDCATAAENGAAAERARNERRSIGVMISHAAGNVDEWDKPHEAGRLLGVTKTSDVVDAVVVTTALRQKATILTSDPGDMERLVRASGREVAVVAI